MRPARAALTGGRVRRGLAHQDARPVALLRRRLLVKGGNPMPTTQPNVNVESLYRPLWLTYGLVPLIAGLDKFFNLLTDWPKYLSPMVANLLPVSAQTFMH